MSPRYICGHQRRGYNHPNLLIRNWPFPARAALAMASGTGIGPPGANGAYGLILLKSGWELRARPLVRPPIHETYQGPWVSPRIDADR